MWPPDHRGFYSSFQYVTLIGGQLSAMVVLLILQRCSSPSEQIRAWGWRIPFVIGALLAVVACRCGATCPRPTSSRRPRRWRARRARPALMKYPREMLLVVGLTMGGTIAFYTYTTYMQKFLKLSVGLTDNQTTP